MVYISENRKKADTLYFMKHLSLFTTEWLLSQFHETVQFKKWVIEIV